PGRSSAGPVPQIKYLPSGDSAMPCWPGATGTVLSCLRVCGSQISTRGGTGCVSLNVPARRGGGETTSDLPSAVSHAPSTVLNSPFFPTAKVSFTLPPSTSHTFASPSAPTEISVLPSEANAISASVVLWWPVSLCCSRGSLPLTSTSRSTTGTSPWLLKL